MKRGPVVVMAAALLVAILAHSCARQTDFVPTSANLPSDLKLASDEQEKVVFDSKSRIVWVSTPKEIKKVEGVRHAVITVKKDGTVEVKAKSYGLCLEPGLGVVIAQGIEPSIDVQFAYWRQFGLLVGAALYPHPEPFVGLAYDLAGLRLANTSILAGYGLRHDLVVGVRLSF